MPRGSRRRARAAGVRSRRRFLRRHSAKDAESERTADVDEEFCERKPGVDRRRDAAPDNEARVRAVKPPSPTWHVRQQSEPSIGAQPSVAFEPVTCHPSAVADSLPCCWGQLRPRPIVAIPALAERARPIRRQFTRSRNVAFAALLLLHPTRRDQVVASRSRGNGAAGENRARCWT